MAEEIQIGKEAFRRPRRKLLLNNNEQFQITLLPIPIHLRNTKPLLKFLTRS